MQRKWKKGERAQLARDLGVTQSQLATILLRKSAVSQGRAIRFAEASKKLLGRNYIPKEAWAFNFTTTHWAFTKGCER